MNNGEIKILKNICLKFLSIIFILSFAFSCVEAPKSKRLSTTQNLKTTTTSTTTSSNLPTFENGNNFFQNGGTVYTATFTLDIDFTDSFYFRGKQVDNYIRNFNNSTPVCMAARFQETGVNKIIVMAMMPKSTYNYTNQSVEYYYALYPSDETVNKNYCQKTALVNGLFSAFPTLVPYYKIKSLCVSGTCATNGYTSLQALIYTNSGTNISTITTNNLIYYIKNTTTNSSTSGSTCTSNSECISQGYDCCSGNQCVKDLQKKSGNFDSDTEYKQALQDILNNPSSIYNYPQYYYICSSTVTVPTNGSTSTTSDIIKAQKRLDKLKRLYNCVNKIHGEYGVCTTVVDNAVKLSTYDTGVDDRNFNTTFTNTNFTSPNIPLSSIEKIYLGEVLVFDYTSKSDIELSQPIFTDSYITLNGHHNDDLSTGAQVTINDFPSASVSKELIIEYKVDSSCTYINTSLAKCEKYYVQGQPIPAKTYLRADELMRHPTDHYPASNYFKIPTYADTSKSITVELDGVKLIEGVDWTLYTSSPSYIALIPSGTASLKAQDEQMVKISFFANSSIVMPSKKAALDEINTMCSCAAGDYRCNLSPVKLENGTISDYVCTYPEANPTTIPVSQKVYLSSKSVPVRLYDNAGVPHASLTADVIQEGTKFSYTNNDLSKPNNLSTYIGFNEIYGSFTYGTNAAKPPQMINVKKGNSYDIFVDYGSFYSCSQCGADYYSQINKLFPSFQYGGGMTPMQFQSNRIASNSSVIRSDEFQFGRACHIPATMLPWSHFPNADLETQRDYRLKTQHFLFANGYQRDWFGFDYGSVIGSFDGVKWFSIGTNRRIKASSNKLFIAINAPIGDLTIESTYTVSINDSILNPAGTGMITTDLESNGAECQKYHQCDKDSDCYTRLGADYTCSAVSEITTSWPVFDENGNEIADTTSEVTQLVSILSASNPGKRCVYRGKGALCTQNYGTVNINTSFNKTAVYDFHSCSSNNYCQSFNGSSGLEYKFNNRLNRYGKVVADSTRDTFGVGTPVTMRPFKYNGDEQITTGALHNLSATKALAMCIPGKNVDALSFQAQNNTAPDFSLTPGDRVVAIGQTKAGYSYDSNYLSACGVFNDDGNYYYKDNANTPITPISGLTDLINSSGSQSISSNSLKIFQSLFDNKGLSFNLFKSPTAILNSLSFQQNTCFKAPGASCYSDLDCSPSKPITDKIKLLSASDTSVTSIINAYELKYWQEPLICSQSAEKTAATFDPRENRCCRDVGNIITIGHASTSYPLLTSTVPALDVALTDGYRYSRVGTYYKEYKDNSTNYPALSIPISNQCTIPNSAVSTGCKSLSSLKNQSNTINLIGTKTSCTDHWVRNFTNGTHNWSVNKFQTFNPLAFRCYNWLPNSYGNWTCSGLEESDAECTVVQTSATSSKGKAILKFLGKLELMGVPQIAIPAEDQYMQAAEGDLSCRSHPASQAANYPGDKNGTIDNYKPSFYFWSNYTSTNYTGYNSAALNNRREIYDSDNLVQMYSTVDTSNFSSSFKQVFKSDEIVSCKPAGTKMNSSSELNLCCTGFINEKTMKCALPDFTDVSIYTNKYISSEAKDLNANLFDEDGYVKDPSYVAQLACAKNICASGKVAYGVLISNLKTPGIENSENKFYRFLQGSSTEDDANGMLTLYNQGLKLNNHAYCLPSNSSGGSNGDLTVISCGSN